MDSRYRIHLIERYQGQEGRRRLIEAMRGQSFVEGDLQLATALADVAQLEEVATGHHLIEQGGDDNDIVLLIAGRADIIINSRKVAERRSGQHVGEMALIDPTARRAATIVATEATVITRIAEDRFSSIADKFPRVWRLLAIEIAQRLRERSKFVISPNDVAHIFIGSSREALEVAKAVAAGLGGEEWQVRLWTEGIFGASEVSIESLEATVRKFDFGVLIFAADDKVFSRNQELAAPRDNVVFELGLFMGALGRGRTFIVLPRGMDLKIPSDLLGVTPLKYDGADGGSLAERLSAVCDELKAAIRRLGPK